MVKTVVYSLPPLLPPFLGSPEQNSCGDVSPFLGKPVGVDALLLL